MGIPDPTYDDVDPFPGDVKLEPLDFSQVSKICFGTRILYIPTGGESTPQLDLTRGSIIN